MQRGKNNCPALIFTAILAACLLIAATAAAQQPSEPDCRWKAGFARQLGIEPDSEPMAGQPVQMLKAQVIDPDRLASVGLVAARRGDRISMLCVGSDVWRIKHYATGLATTFSTRPF